MAPHRTLMGLFQKKSKQGRRGAGREVEDMEFPEVLRKYCLEFPEVNKKRSRISRDYQKKSHVEFPWVLVFQLGNSSACSTILWSFQG